MVMNTASKHDVVVNLRTTGINKVMTDFQTLRASINRENAVISKQGQMMARQQLLTNNLMKGSAQKLVDNADKVNKLGKEFNSFGKVMSMPFEQWRNFVKDGGEFESVGAKNASKIRLMTHGMRGFRMELLSVMFGAQMVSKAMWGLLKPAMEATGIFELISTMLLLLFLPTALKVLEFLIDFVDWFINLPEPIKEVIGAIVLLFGAFATFLASKAAIDLFFGGMIKHFSELGGLLPGLTSEFTKFTKLLAIPVSVYFASETLKDLKEGKVLEAILNAVVAGAGIAYTLGKISGKTAILLGIGAYFGKTAIEHAKVGEWKEAIADAIISGGGLLMFKYPVAGGTLMAIGFTVKFYEPLKEEANKAGKYLHDLFYWGGESFSMGLGKIGKFTADLFGGRQTGGYIPHTGLYKLHAGETVQQSNTSNFMPSVYVNASSNVDIEMLKSQLSSQWANDYDRLSRG